jgi:hypothetical protein
LGIKAFQSTDSFAENDGIMKKPLLLKQQGLFHDAVIFCKGVVCALESLYTQSWPSGTPLRQIS